MATYKALRKQVFSSGNYSLVPIRMEDRYDIMKWRNEQLYHLRQKELLSLVDQDKYFDTVVEGLFYKEQPEQILFSYLDNGNCIGYGGLVHINWRDQNAEISFIMDTALEENSFETHWMTYLNMIEEVGFRELSLHKLFVYAFDIRPHLYETLQNSQYFEDARLKEHCLIESRFLDVVIYSKLNDN